jgi:hypothetical protein
MTKQSEHAVSCYFKKNKNKNKKEEKLVDVRD